MNAFDETVLAERCFGSAAEEADEPAPSRSAFDDRRWSMVELQMLLNILDAVEFRSNPFLLLLTLLEQIRIFSTSRDNCAFSHAFASSHS